MRGHRQARRGPARCHATSPGPFRAHVWQGGADGTHKSPSLQGGIDRW